MSEPTSEPTTLQLGKYRLLGRIGYGGMAEVWVAHQQGPMGFEKLVAIKRLLPHMEGERQFVRMFLDEARIAARINHANVVQIFDLGLAEQTFFIAMEYLDGESLARVMGEGIKRGNPLSVPLAAMILSQICKGLHHAHSLRDAEGQLMGLVHRDVSPQNVMVLNDGGVKLLDFGIAKARERLSETTATGMKGKYAYMSPEQCQGLEIDHRSDLFSCGVVLWETLTRRRLFKHQSKLMVLKMITEGHVPPPSKINPEVPPELDAVATKALCKLPSSRFSSAMEMSGAIELGLIHAGLAVTVSQIAEYMEQVFGEDQRQRRSWIGSASTTPRFLEGQTSEHFLDMIPDSTTVVSFSKSAVGTSAGHHVPRQSPIWWIMSAVIATLAAVAATILILITPSETGGSRLRIESTPPGAMVVVDGKLRTGLTPGVVSELEPGPHDVDLVLKGHLPWKRRISLGDGETLRMEAALVPKEREVSSAPLRSDSGEIASKDIPDARPVAARPDLRQGRPDAATVVPVRRPRKPEGMLNLATAPWATIYLGRRRLGDTPLVRAKLPVGTIRLRAVNREAKIDATFTVTIAKDELTRKFVRLPARSAVPAPPGSIPPSPPWDK